MISLNEWLQPYLVWFVVGIAMLLLELAAPGLIIAFFGMGAVLVGAICLFVDIPVNAQLAIFILSSLLLLIALRRHLKVIFMGSVSSRPEADEDPSDLIGKRAVVVREIRRGVRGRVEIHGTGWAAESDGDIPEGTTVEIIGKDSITLKVKATA